MSKKQKKMLARILIAAALMIGLHFVPAGGMARFILYLVPYLIIGYDILLKAFKGVKNRQPFDESLLMAVATVGAIVIALTDSGDYTEAIAVMLEEPQEYQRPYGHPPGLRQYRDRREADAG